ncbi:MAG: tetratricopeptide repeat protein [Roseiflexaceae bacterium]
MAESDTILQLGIEAAREGNREEARNLFGLLTRQEPDNAQAWLWLAGVADGPEQRRAALERAVELDPTNEMAVKGLQAMGVHPTVKLDEADIPSAPPDVAFAAAEPERPMTDEERYAAELDSAFDDYDTVPRSETPRRDVEDTATAVGSAVAADRATSSVRSARERSAARRASTPIRSDEDDEMRVAPVSRPNNLLWLLVGLIALLLVGYLAYRFLFNRSGGEIVADNPTSIAATVIAGAGTGQEGTPLPTVEGQLGGTGVLTGTTGIAPTPGLTDTTGITPTAVLTDTTGAPPVQPPASQGQIPVPVANPNAQPVSLGTQLDANGWVYTYPDASFVLVLGKQVGSFTTQGTYLHVLVWVANNTGTAQPIPANFFALKDAQGTVYVGQPQVSSAAVQRGVNADTGMEDAIPANGSLTSVYLVFDVPPGAQGLFLFAAGKSDQGWPLNVVP